MKSYFRVATHMILADTPWSAHSILGRLRRKTVPLAAGFGRLRLCLKFIWKQSVLHSESENVGKRSKSMRELSFILCAVVLSN